MLNFFKNRKKRIGSALAVTILVILIAIPLHKTHAAWDLGASAALYAMLVKGLQNLALWASVAMLTIGGWVLGFAGLVLESVMQYSILNMASNVNGPLAPVISASWTAFRDIANMAFIFILLYISIGTILGLGGVDMKKTLTRVIIVALLLNFSLFFTKIIVDGSNIVSTVFYNKIIEDNPFDATKLSGGISGAFMTKFGLTSLFSPETASKVITGISTGDPSNPQSNGVLQMLMFGAFGMIFMVVAAFVFGAIALMFISRFVILIFLFILSPLAFAAMALPNDKYSGKWWNSLWNQILFAPACLALLWVVTQVLNGIIPPTQTVGGVAGIGGALVATSGGLLATAGKTIMNFIIVIAFMVGTLIIAKEFGAYGAGGLMKTGTKLRKNVQGYFGGATFGAAGYLGRRTVGRVARGVADIEKLKDIQSRGGVAGTLVGALRGGAKKTAGASFDVRASALGKELAGTIGGVGKAGGRGGYDEFVKGRQKRAVDTAKDLEPSQVKSDQAQQLLEREKTFAGALSGQIDREEGRLEAGLREQKKALEELNARQKEDEQKMNDSSIPLADKATLKNTMENRAATIKAAENRLNLDPRTTELSNIKKARAEIQANVDRAQKRVDEYRGVSEQDARQRFQTSGKKSQLQKEAEVKFGKDAEKIKQFMKEEEEKYIRLEKRDDAGKRRALDYAKSKEEVWRKSFRLFKNKREMAYGRTVFTGTRYHEAQKIRSEFSKSKEDKRWDKIISALPKEKRDDVEKPPEKEGEE